MAMSARMSTIWWTPADADGLYIKARSDCRVTWCKTRSVAAWWLPATTTRYVRCRHRSVTTTIRLMECTPVESSKTA